MSYTAPQYVDTKEQAVLALASVIADEDKTALGNGSVNRALDVLADVLAQQDVSVPQTNAGAILALAQYVTGGGGSSDFTTAKVTFILSGGGTVSADNLDLCTVSEISGIAASTPWPLESGTSPFVVDAILYKGGAELGLLTEASATSGAIESLGDGYYLITGDCTVTLE